MYNYIITALALLFTSSVFAQDSLTMKKAIEKTLENNFSITMSKMEVEKAQINNTWQATGRYPMLDFSLNSINKINYVDTDYSVPDNIDVTQYNSNPLSGEDNTQNILSGKLALNWLLFDGFQTSIRKEKLAYFEELSNGNTALLVENTVFSVMISYYKILLEKEQLAVLQKLETVSEDRYTYTQEQKKYGTVGSFDVLQAQNAWLEDKSKRMQQEMNLRNSIRDLKYIMADEDDTEYLFLDSISFDQTDIDASSLKSKMHSNNKTLKLQSINLQMAINEVRSTKNSIYPKLQMSAGSEYSRSTTGYDLITVGPNSNLSLFANFSLVYNLYGGGQKRRAQKIAKIDQEIATIKIEDQKRQLDNELDKLYDEYIIKKELLNLQQERVTAAELNLSLAEARFKAGSINSFNYRDVQNLYQNTYTAYILAQFNLLTSHLQLLRISGGLLTEE